MKHAQFDVQGLPVAFYSEDVHGPLLIDGEPNPDCLIPSGTIEITEHQWLDFINNGGLRRWDGVDVVEYVPPAREPEIPTQITMRQAKLMLHRVGMLEEIDARMAAMPGDEGVEARIEWDFGSTLERDHPLVAEMGVPPEQVDSLFFWASAL